MKSEEELNALKEEIELLNKKLAELNEEELKEVVGGNNESSILPSDDEFWHSWNPVFPFFDSDKGLK